MTTLALRGPMRWPFPLNWLLVALLWLLAGWAQALTLSPTSVSMPVGSYSNVAVSSAKGSIQAESSNTAVAIVALSKVTSTGATLSVQGKGVGTTKVLVRDTVSGNLTLNVTVTAALKVTPTSLSVYAGSTAPLAMANASGTVTVTSANTAVASATVSGTTLNVRGVAAGATTLTVKDSRSAVTVPVTVLAVTPVATTRYSLIAWNDLGMHCMDGKDYSVFSILPPFNNLNAQLVNATTGKAVTSGVTLSYEAVADPAGSINTRSADKTNFWSWAGSLYGATPAANVGLTGNYTPSATARAMKLNTANGWFEATGLPVTPYDDAYQKNFYPTVKVTARDATGKLLASTTTVLPVSDEITCASCHASRAATETNTARLAAKPKAGWVNTADAERDWKLNILRLHDEKQAGNATYLSALTANGTPAGLYDAALRAKPTLCASCHATNALSAAGRPGVSALTSAQHASHGKVIDPSTMLSLDSSSNRSACYQCHPGSVTKCLRGAMGNAVDAAGNAVMGCQSCHGNMTKVGNPARVGWLQQPNCQACHYDGKRTTTALDAAGNLVKPADTRFATNANTPSSGFSLYRFSKGHGGLQCEACHGSTHAEYPSSHANDNLQSIALQGYAGTLRECSTCHATVPLSGNGGPHGMHTIGAAWVSGHGDRISSSGGTAACAYCHGSDYRGSPLAQVKAARSYKIETGTKSYVAGQKVGCYDCHNGPKP